jgi:hypothetical protein
LKLSESDTSRGVNPEQFNTASWVMQANSTAAGWYSSTDNLEATLDAWATGANQFFTAQFAAWRPGAVTYTALARDALQTTRPGMIIPFHLKFPIPWDVGGAVPRTVYYPPQVIAGGTAPAVSNRDTVNLPMGGGRYDWQVEFQNTASAIVGITRTAATAYLMASETVTFYILMRTTAAHTGTALSITIADAGGSSTTTVIAGVGVGGLSANYTWFTASHTLSAAPAYLTVTLANLSGGGVTGIHVGMMDMQVTTIGTRNTISHRPWLEKLHTTFLLSGAPIAPGYYTKEGVAGNTIAYAFTGDIVAYGIDIHEAVAPAGAGGDASTMYIEGVETDAAGIVAGATWSDFAGTPTAALTIDGGAEPGARIWLRLRTVCAGAGGNYATADAWAYIIRG